MQTFVGKQFHEFGSIAFGVQKHWLWSTKALTLECKSNALEVTEHCSGCYGALLWRLRSIALEVTEHCSGCYGALLYISMEHCSLWYGALFPRVRSIAFTGWKRVEEEWKRKNPLTPSKPIVNKGDSEEKVEVEEKLAKKICEMNMVSTNI